MTDMHLLVSGEGGQGTGLVVKGRRVRRSYCGLEGDAQHQPRVQGGQGLSGSWKATYNINMVTCGECLHAAEK